MKKLGCEMCHAPHNDNTKFVYIFASQIKLCLDCAKSWNRFYHEHPEYNASLVDGRIGTYIWTEWVEMRENELKREKVSFT